MYLKLGRQLKSDIIYLELLGQELVVLNSAQAASDLLEKRSSLYSDRPCPTILGDKSLFDWSTNPIFIGYNDTWKHHRRMMNKWLNKKDVAQLYQIQENRARALLQRFLGISMKKDPFHEVKDELSFTTASSIFQAAYGYTLQDKNDPFYQAAREVDANSTRTLRVDEFPVNLFPFLKWIPEWLPGGRWKRTIQKWREQKDIALDGPYHWTRDQVRQGTGEHSIVGSLLEDHALMLGLSAEEKDDRLRQLGHILYTGARDTTLSILLSFIAAMVTNPACQTRAQEEIDLALGPGVIHLVHWAPKVLQVMTNCPHTDRDARL